MTGHSPNFFLTLCVCVCADKKMLNAQTVSARRALAVKTLRPGGSYLVHTRLNPFAVVEDTFDVPDDDPAILLGPSLAGFLKYGDGDMFVNCVVPFLTVADVRSFVTAAWDSPALACNVSEEPRKTLILLAESLYRQFDKWSNCAGIIDTWKVMCPRVTHLHDVQWYRRHLYQRCYWQAHDASKLLGSMLDDCARFCEETIKELLDDTVPRCALACGPLHDKFARIVEAIETWNRCPVNFYQHYVESTLHDKPCDTTFNHFVENSSGAHKFYNVQRGDRCALSLYYEMMSSMCGPVFVVPSASFIKIVEYFMTEHCGSGCVLHHNHWRQRAGRSLADLDGDGFHPAWARWMLESRDHRPAVRAGREGLNVRRHSSGFFDLHAYDIQYVRDLWGDQEDVFDLQIERARDEYLYAVFAGVNPTVRECQRRLRAIPDKFLLPSPPLAPPIHRISCSRQLLEKHNDRLHNMGHEGVDTVPLSSYYGDAMDLHFPLFVQMSMTRSVNTARSADTSPLSETTINYATTLASIGEAVDSQASTVVCDMGRDSDDDAEMEEVQVWIDLTMLDD